MWKEDKQKKKERRKRYYDEHREEERTYQKKYREEHKEYHRKYNEEHKEQRKEWSKQYYTKNKDRLLVRNKKYNDAHKEQRKKYREEHKEDERCNRLLRDYNVSSERYNAMFKLQRERCAVCLKISTSGPLHIDHDHSCCPGKRSCGKCVRELLCTKCNSALGLIDDSPERLKQLQHYLEKWKKGATK